MDLNLKLVKTEKEAKEFDFDARSLNKYPIYFFKTDTSGEKTYEEFLYRRGRL